VNSWKQANDCIGGQCRSEEKRGRRCAAGSHRVKRITQMAEMDGYEPWHYEAGMIVPIIVGGDTVSGWRATPA
jgi:hypothetical protein